MSKNTPTRGSWKSMMARCSNPKAWGYAEYGAKGIVVCERWSQFWAFLEDMGERPPGTSIDRIDGTKGYEPGNCRWATRSQQNRNRRKYVIVRKNRNPNQRKSPGRPPLPPEERESLYLTIRISEERRDRYQRAANEKEAGNLSKWAKKALDKASK